MSKTLYSSQHRALQDEFDSRRMADLMEGGIVHDTLSEVERTFITSVDMFFLSTVDHNGHPTVSYKGGLPGFVKVLDERTIAFPSYDGNGMFYSMGNISATAKVGFLFIDFETPNRLRVQGNASIDREHPLMADYPEAQFIVKVAIERIWLNCPRYIHKRIKVSDSKYVPQAHCETPVPAWKRIDFVQEALPAKDQGAAERVGGLITFEEYGAKLMQGDA
uniref:pyridoxamine 5'-phosphate oxidase family protein n=1 Tax=Limnohabitans sp. TaxID=1907725 RepID=UPI0040483F39